VQLDELFAVSLAGTLVADLGLVACRIAQTCALRSYTTEARKATVRRFGKIRSTRTNGRVSGEVPVRND
jgi:hypothetical protein